jgi:prophage maintenance system killer protein
MLAMVSLLMNDQYQLNPSPDDLYNFVINISTGALSLDGIVKWLKANTEVW